MKPIFIEVVTISLSTIARTVSNWLQQYRQTFII